ncbi:MAG: trypsin-like peptidase domain-containing protein [Chloroflexi bacterium]|nr:trypsin-like peptidase domain-containing protein [Chloroflexota bacterium]
MKRILIALSVLVLATLACSMGASQRQPTALPSAAQDFSPQPVVIDSAKSQEALVALYQSVSPGVVAIKTVGDLSGSLGSGFVLDKDGHIVTNYHVVEGSKQVEVDFTSGFKAYGAVIGTDLDSDLAIVKVDAPANELHPLPLADSDTLQVGQTVIAIGNPFGLNSTMTLGIISALGRTLDSLHATSGGGVFTAGDIIQTDAAINPGNSGGPLFNLSGEVVGVNRAIRTVNSTDSGEPLNSGIGFAISSNIVRRVSPSLIENGKYDYPYLGISSLPGELTLPAIEALGLKSQIGAYVIGVVPGGPADKAGIKAGDKATSDPTLLAGGDLIVAIDGRPVKVFDDLLRYLIGHKSPGDAVTLTILRGEETVDIVITLGKRP